MRAASNSSLRIWLLSSTKIGTTRRSHPSPRSARRRGTRGYLRMKSCLGLLPLLKGSLGNRPQPNMTCRG
jgi:hypothetical protein